VVGYGSLKRSMCRLLADENDKIMSGMQGNSIANVFSSDECGHRKYRVSKQGGGSSWDDATV